MSAGAPEPVHVEQTPSGTPWRLGVLVGGAIFAFGLVGLLHNARTTIPSNWLQYVAGALILHDALLVPTVLVAGLLLSRLAPPAVRSGLQATCAVCGVVALMSVPVLLAQGRRADNPSLLPHAYGTNLALVLAAILAVGALTTGVRMARRRPRKRA